MKFLMLIGSLMISVMAFSQNDVSKKDPNKKTEVVEVSCGQCNFKLKTQSGCDLAVRINGKAYFVDGTDINDHGDAHEEDGFCNAIRKAEVQGKIEGNRFHVTYFKLLPEQKIKK